MGMGGWAGRVGLLVAAWTAVGVLRATVGVVLDLGSYRVPAWLRLAGYDKFAPPRPNRSFPRLSSAPTGPTPAPFQTPPPSWFKSSFTWRTWGTSKSPQW